MRRHPSGLAVNAVGAQTSMATVCLPTWTCVRILGPLERGFHRLCRGSKPSALDIRQQFERTHASSTPIYLPDLERTFNFNNRWTGHDVYFFMFKYTDSNGNNNGATWGQNPGKFIRNLPANTHLFYGSFDNSYHNDVIQQRNAVLAV